MGTSVTVQRYADTIYSDGSFDPDRRAKPPESDWRTARDFRNLAIADPPRLDALPTLSPNHPLYRAEPDAPPAGDFLHRHSSRRILGANASDCFCGVDCRAVEFTSGAEVGAVFHAVAGVCTVRVPPKVFETVICRVAVVVAALHSCGTGSGEDGEYKNVDEKSVAAWVKTNPQIPACELLGLQSPPGVADYTMATANATHPNALVTGPDRTITAYAVTGIVW